MRKSENGDRIYSGSAEPARLIDRVNPNEVLNLAKGRREAYSFKPAEWSERLTPG